jgi:hypothetical protein
MRDNRLIKTVMLGRVEKGEKKRKTEKTLVG